jgi:predicted transcriptional regulator
MSLYNPITESELAEVLGEDPEAVAETLATLLEKRIIEEHHDGGFTFNAVYVDHILGQDPNQDLHELYGDLELG